MISIQLYDNPWAIVVNIQTHKGGGLKFFFDYYLIGDVPVV